MENKDLSNLKGRDLYYYVLDNHPDKDFSEGAEALSYALEYDMGKVYSTLERIVRENKKFVFVYPMLGDVATDDMEFIGDIIDGGLYIK